MGVFADDRLPDAVRRRADGCVDDESLATLSGNRVPRDPATHLGGSMYLFVRGMVGVDTPVVDGERCGVARWRPPPEMIVAISNLFVGPRS